MKSRRRIVLFWFWSFFLSMVSGQRILITEPDKEDSRRMNFEIIGKMGNNFLIYKNNAGTASICVYDNNMKLVQKVKHEFLPDERLINVDFFPYPDFFYIIYQYQKRNIVNCTMVKMDAMGKRISDPVLLDTTLLSGNSSNKIYTVLSSEDKQKIIIFKINNRNREKYIITSHLYNDKLEWLNSSRLTMPMHERNENLGEFALDNEGNLVFTKFYRSNNENISSASLVVKRTMEDSFSFYPVNLTKIFLDEIRVKVDNNNKRYLLSSFYYNQKKGNIEGLYFMVLNKETWTAEIQNTFEFSEDLRRDAKGEANIKMAFNDYFIRNIIVKKNGGVLLNAEAYYTTSRSSAWNRWDYMYGYPYYLYPSDYYYSPYYNSWGMQRYYGSQSNYAVRHHADNLVIFSFGNQFQLEWSNVISKSQFDDESTDRISYQLMNTGGQLHYLFNLQEKRNLLLNDYSLTPDGQLTRNPTLRNLDQGHEFMPQYGKQVSARQFLVPCIIRNNICFAKIEFN
jgi:hypothetical protein